MILKNRLKAV